MQWSSFTCFQMPKGVILRRCDEHRQVRIPLHALLSLSRRIAEWLLIANGPNGTATTGSHWSCLPSPRAHKPGNRRSTEAVGPVR
jgi:hypothetical protein